MKKRDPFMQHRPTGTIGASLVELIVAFSIFTTGFIGSIQTLHVGMDKLRTLREIVIAESAVQKQIETIRCLPFPAISDCKQLPFTTTVPQQDELAGARTSLTIEPYNANSRLKQVHAEIVWRGDRGRLMKRSADTLLANVKGTMR